MSMRDTYPESHHHNQEQKISITPKVYLWPSEVQSDLLLNSYWIVYHHIRNWKYYSYILSFARYIWLFASIL